MTARTIGAAANGRHDHVLDSDASVLARRSDRALAFGATSMLRFASTSMSLAASALCAGRRADPARASFLAADHAPEPSE